MELSELNKKNLKKLLIGVFSLIAAGIVLYWLLNETERVSALFAAVKKVISPFIIGASIAFIFNVPMRAIEGKLKKIRKLQLRRLVAVVLTLILILLVLSLVCLLLIPQLIQTVQSLIPTLYDFFLEVEGRVDAFLSNNPQLMQWVIDNTDLENLDLLGIIQKVLSMAGNSISTIVASTFTALGSIASAIVNTVISLVFAVYCLFQKETLARQGKKLLYAFLPEHVSDQIIRVMRLTNSTFSNFLSGQCVEVCILGCMFAIAMAIFRMPYIPLVSVLVAVTAFIPVVGAWVGCVLGAFFILVDNPMMAVWFVVMFLVIQQIENNMIYPRVVGTSIGLSGMWVLVAVSVGGAIMGVAGMFLMIPFTSVLYTLLHEATNKRLVLRGIDPEKMTAEPPEFRSNFPKKGAGMKKKWSLKKTTKTQNVMDGEEASAHKPGEISKDQ